MSQSKQNSSSCLNAFRVFGKLNAFISRSMEGLHSAIFMGLMNDRDLQDYDTYPFGDWEGASQVTGETKYVEDWLETFISKHVDTTSRVLVVGAGGGRELLKIREAGGIVSGLEFDKALFEETSGMLSETKAGDAVCLRHAERFNLEGEAKDFDIVVVPRFYLSYVQSRTERVRFLSACRERLKDGGVLAFDYFTRPEGVTSPGALIFRIQPPISNFLRFIRGRGNRSVEAGDHLDPQVPLLHHHYNQSGLDRELADSGLDKVDQGETWFGWTVAKSSSEARYPDEPPAPEVSGTSSAKSRPHSPASV